MGIDRVSFGVMKMFSVDCGYTTRQNIEFYTLNGCCMVCELYLNKAFFFKITSSMETSLFFRERLSFILSLPFLLQSTLISPFSQLQ